MAQHDDERRAEYGSAIFQGADRAGIREIAGVAGDEQLAESAATEDQFRRDAAVGAGKDRCPRRLSRGDFGALRRQIDLALLRLRDKALIALDETLERVLRGARCFARRGASCKGRRNGEWGYGSGERAGAERKQPPAINRIRVGFAMHLFALNGAGWPHHKAARTVSGQ